FGHRAFFGYLVRSDGEVYWFANLTRPEPARGSTRETTSEEWLDLLKSLHADDPAPVRQILVHASGLLRGYPMYELARLARWHRGNVVAIRMRDLIVPMFLRKASSDTTSQWIYDYHVDWAA